MTFKTQLQADLKAAMKARDVITRDTLRMVKTDINKAELDKGEDLSPDEIIKVLAYNVKTRKDSAKQYVEGGRQELADKELAEIKVIEQYLPKALSEDEAREIMIAIAKELGVTEKKQMGQLIKETTSRYRGQIEGRLASKIAGSLLS